MIAWMTFTPVQIDKLRLSSGADPPADKLDQLLADDAKVREIWSRQRKGLDKTPAAGDLTLAVELLKAGWSDQETADAIIAARRRHNEQLDEVLCATYMSETLYRAKTSESVWPHALRSPLNKLLIPAFGSMAIVLVGFLVGLFVGRLPRKQTRDSRR